MGAAEGKPKKSNDPWLWPILLVIAGIVLLFDNFLLLGDFNAVALLPLLLVIAGAQILLRGDFTLRDDVRTFGITRGSVESGTLEISSGEVDVEIGALQREGRLIAGQFAADSRPQLHVEDTYAHLKMSRNRTPWFSMADWQIGVARDLPWQILISTFLGRVNLDLAPLIVHDIVVGSGFGSVHLVVPQESLGRVYLRSTLGNIHLTTPLGYNTRIIIEKGWFADIFADEYRYEEVEGSVFESVDFDDTFPLVEIHISSTFGDIYLA